MKFFAAAALTALVASASAMPAEQTAMSAADYDGILSKFKHLFDIFKHDAADFLKCMGPGSIHDCKTEMEHCVIDRAHCLQELGHCESDEAKKCIHHLHDKK